MLSGRGLGHTGGTLDKLEAIDGYRIDLSPQQILAQVEAIGCSISGQTGDIAPADRRIYHLRDVTATVDCIPLIVSSILSKKLAAGPANLVIDLKCGSGAFMRDVESARDLATALIATGTRAGVSMSALITDMSQPLGEAVGHANETLEAIQCLRGAGPADLRELTIELVAEMGDLAGIGRREALRPTLAAMLDDGSALARFERMVNAQGGRLDLDREDAGLKIAPEAHVLRAPHAGSVAPMDAAAMGLALVEIGGARRSHEDVLDLSAGLSIPVRVGDRVDEGDALAILHAADSASAERCAARLREAMPIRPEAEAATPSPALVLDRVAS